MVEIRQLNPTRSNLKKFVEFQIDLYKGNPYFVPPLVSDEIATLDSKVNPSQPISWLIATEKQSVASLQ